MSNIVKFAIRERHAGRLATHVQDDCEIIIFPGVRYEYWVNAEVPAADAALEPSGSKRAGSKRRRRRRARAKTH